MPSLSRRHPFFFSERSLQRVQQNGEDEEQDGGDEHHTGGDDGEESQFAFERAGFVFGEKGIGAARNGAHIVARSFLHDNDDDHRDAGKCHQYEKGDTKPKENFGFCRCCDQCV